MKCSELPHDEVPLAQEPLQTAELPGEGSAVPVTAPKEGEKLLVASYGSTPVLLTAPHSIHLLRDGCPAHMLEEHTAELATAMAQLLGGASLTWSPAERRWTRHLWALAAEALLDEENRDPNYLRVAEVQSNAWFLQMRAIRQSFGGLRGPALLLDLHGSKDPPENSAHLFLGLGAMYEAAASDSDSSQLEAFAESLVREVKPLICSLGLQPLLAEPVKAVLKGQGFSGICERGRLTQTQQAIQLAGFSHAVQLELSRALRRALAANTLSFQLLARALERAWWKQVGRAAKPGQA